MSKSIDVTGPCGNVQRAFEFLRLTPALSRTIGTKELIIMLTYISVV